MYFYPKPLSLLSIKVLLTSFPSRIHQILLKQRGPWPRWRAIDRTWQSAIQIPGYFPRQTCRKTLRFWRNWTVAYTTSKGDLRFILTRCWDVVKGSVSHRNICNPFSLHSVTISVNSLWKYRFIKVTLKLAICSLTH